MKNIAIYYRVSTDRQDLDSQRQAVETWLEELPASKKPKKTLVFADEGISGKTVNRPQFQEMLRVAYEGRIDTIVCYRLDRFSRNATTAIKTILNLDEAGVAFISVTQPVLNLGHENPFRRTMLAAFAEIAEIERETIVTRVKAGLDAARKRGVRLGRPTIATRALQLQARALRQEGRTYKDISREMNLSVGKVHQLIQTPLADAEGESPEKS